MSQSSRFPEVKFVVKRNEDNVADKIYLGLFLAVALFFAWMFGNFLFVIIVAILSLLIMLSYDTEGREVECVLGKDEIVYGRHVYPLDMIRYFTIVENTLDNKRVYIRLSFQNYLETNQYIPLPASVQKDTIYAILSSKLDESPVKELSFIEMLMLKFFKW